MIVLLLLTVFTSAVNGCGAGGSGDNEYIQNPVFAMTISPPIGWTYFPTTPSVANTAIWYFVGQSNDTLTAKDRADSEITAAMLEAIVAANLPVTGVTVSNDYQPIVVENPIGSTTWTGSLYGKVEGGALTQTSPGTTAGTTVLTYQPYTRQLRVTVNNAATTRFYWNIVKNTFLQKMSMNFHARFAGEVTISKV
ncbi:unnamed protein product [Caenorhabditis auriculariae]|uniref:Uncharacterized protein n=1 Tax=Caenorhabditis auriculariae TaxID=2777116 RepID=A0A8S1H8C7_9PELO|nr:unnamed protein product [Caenorhabditis auriculariae]